MPQATSAITAAGGLLALKLTVTPLVCLRYEPSAKSVADVEHGKVVAWRLALVSHAQESVNAPGNEM